MIATAVAVAVLGLIVGSFLNVCIARLPLGQSLLQPRSSCPGCRTAIAWHDNVPVISYVLLRGRCRSCQMWISPRYPVVELVTAGLFVLAYARFGMTAQLVAALILVSALVVITGIDLAHQTIPDVITLPGIIVGVLANLVTGSVSWVQSLAGVLVGGGLFFVIILASGGGMGGGDMKLGAMLGAFLGFKVVLLAVLIAVLIGGAVAVILLATRTRGRKDPIPFGPFLAVGGAGGLFWGDRLLAWYLESFQ